MTDVRFGIAIPQSFSAAVDGGERLADFIAFAERSGFDSLWAQEQLLGRDPSLEPLTSLAFAAALTSRVRLGSATVVGPLRDPILLAKVCATIDRLSGGRLVVGLSVGEVAQIYQTVGVDMSERGVRLDEMVDVLVKLWTDEGATHRGRWTLAEAPMEPKPVQSPQPEIWFGGHSRAALKRVVRSGTGWIGAGGSSLADFARGASILAEELEAADRAREEITVAKKIYVAVSDRPEDARKGLENWFSVHWRSSSDPKEMAERVGVAGNSELVAEAIAATINEGADLVILNPVFDEANQTERLIALLEDHGFGFGLDAGDL
ncbi:MAG: LLM class flavin-dependent oxidoreductase [Acidimicrobiia bacterium]